MTTAARGTRKNSKTVAVGLSISVPACGSGNFRKRWRRTRGVKSFTRRATRQWQFTTWSSLEITCQSVDPRADRGSECLKSNYTCQRYQCCGDGILGQLKPGFIFPKVSKHDPFLPFEGMKA